MCVVTASSITVDNANDQICGSACRNHPTTASPGCYISVLVCVCAVKPSDSDTIFMVVILVTGVGCVFILFALMALCYRYPRLKNIIEF